MSVYSKMEIDVMQASELKEASELACKYKLPALVVHPGLSSEALFARGKVNGQFKLITPIDWPKGETFGMNKLRGLSTDSLDADGFEILLSASNSESDARNEARAISEFISKHLSPLVEIRFVLGSHIRTPDMITRLCNGLRGLPTPKFVRNDTQLKLQVSKANAGTHNDTTSRIKSAIAVPIKISGNIGDVRTMMACKDATRFGVSLLQAKNIIKEFQQQPAEVKKLLD